MANIRRLPARLGTFCVLSFAVSQLRIRNTFRETFLSRGRHTFELANRTKARPILAAGNGLGTLTSRPKYLPKAQFVTENDLLSMVFYPARR